MMDDQACPEELMAKQQDHVQVITSREAWRSWLLQNHHQPDGLWLITFKKHR